MASNNTWKARLIIRKKRFKILGGPCLHQPKERLVNGRTRSCRQKVGTGEHRPLWQWSCGLVLAMGDLSGG